jgi:ribonuclease HIII
MLDKYNDITARRENLANLRRAIRAHCQAIELLKQLERDEMTAIGDTFDGISRQMTGAVGDAMAVRTVYLN